MARLQNYSQKILAFAFAIIFPSGGFSYVQGVSGAYSDLV